MSNDEYDDGLVHSHGWATEPPPGGRPDAPWRRIAAPCRRIPRRRPSMTASSTPWLGLRRAWPDDRQG